MNIRVTEEGVFVPKRFFKGIEEVYIRKKINFIALIPNIRKDPILGLGDNPIQCNVADASENLDKYLYGTNE